MKLYVKKINLKIYIEPLFIIITLCYLVIPYFKKFLEPYYMCYLFITFHELGHILVGSFFGKKLKEIKLYGVGLNAVFENSYYKRDRNYLVESLICLAGPLSNIILAIMFGNIKNIFEINAFLAIINLLPIFPLDGYGFLKNILKQLHIKTDVLKHISRSTLLIIFLVSIIQIYSLKNPSLMIFLLYIFNINLRKNV